MSLGFKIQFLNINESYFKGKVEFQNKEYTINIQNERRGKVLKLPFNINSKKVRMLVRLTGSGDIFIEDYLPFKGESEWVEIDSNEITFYIADHQDKFDTLEVVYE
ncbi:MAG: hypothetical protein NPMRd3_140004 [Nitrosopumilales archaeon]|nr:MAG: hypothetical protein NPMRd3_140004 [Nitrosopumilales archaeon]